VKNAVGRLEAGGEGGEGGLRSDRLFETDFYRR